MPEYIERQAAFNAIFDNEFDVSEWGGNFGYTQKTIEESLDMVPAADVAPVVHGAWITVTKMYGTYSGRCSVCGLYSGVWHINQPYKYCPFCGAKIDRGADDADD